MRTATRVSSVTLDPFSCSWKWGVVTVLFQHLPRGKGLIYRDCQMPMDGNVQALDGNVQTFLSVPT